MAMMSNLVRNRRTVFAERLSQLRGEPTLPPPQSLPTTLGSSVKNFFNKLCYYVAGSPRAQPPVSNPPLSIVPTTNLNNLLWSVWKWIFIISSTSFVVCLGYAPFVAMFETIPPSYLLFGLVLFLTLSLAMNRSFAIEANTVRWVDKCMWFLGLDYYVALRLVKLIFINLFYSAGLEEFGLIVVYVSSLYSVSSISVSKMAGSRSAFWKTTIGDFVTTLFTPFYNHLVKRKNYADACVYGVPIILALVARATDMIYPPVKPAPAVEAQRIMAEVFGDSEVIIHVQPEGEGEGAAVSADWMV